MNTQTHFKVMIVDDELNAREVLKIMIKRYIPTCTIIGESSSVQESIQKIDTLKPDIILLDIELPDGTGFDVLEGIKHSFALTIFVTAFDHYAIKAIKFNAFDYILKPVDYKELILVFDSIREHFSPDSIQQSLQNYRYNKSVSKTGLQKIAVPYKGEHVYVELCEIMWCQAEKSYTTLHLEHGKNIVSSKNLGEFEKILPSADDFDDFFFHRIHHGTLLNTKFINSYHPKTASIELKDKTLLKVSERRKVKFQKALQLITDIM